MVSLRLDNVRKAYPDFHLELDFQVRPGELLALLGPSGCGKTTTLRLIAGFIEADGGTVSMNGARIDTLPPHRRRIGIVFQDYALFTHLNVWGNVGFGLRMHGWSRADSRERVRELLLLVSLEGYGRRKVTRLSGGEQQRVALARALAPRPQLLLLDEPLSALDARLRKSLRREILRVQRDLGISTLYVTHDQEEALVLGDRIAVMRDGRIEQIGTPEEVYNRPQNLFVATFLGQSNLIRSSVEGSGGRHALVNTAFGRLKAPLPEGRSVKPGEEVVLFFRPESCSLGDGGENRIRGLAAGREYLGSHLLLEVEAGPERFTLDLGASAPPSPGEPVRFSFDPERCCLLPPG